MITNYKIKSGDFTGLDVSSLPDQPSMPAADLKARFDSPAKVVVSGRVNLILDALASNADGVSGAHQIGSAAVEGVNNLNGAGATILHDQISALQRNITSVVNKDFPSNSLDGSKIMNGTVTADKLAAADLNKIRATVEMDIAPGETLETPCVVRIGENGVETPKPRIFRGLKHFWGDSQLESGDGILHNPLIYPLFGDFVISSYYRCVSAGNLRLTVAIGRLENGSLAPAATVYTGTASVSAGVQTPLTIQSADGGVWLAGFTDAPLQSTFICAFKFDGETYQHIGRHDCLPGIGAQPGRLTPLGGGRFLLKHSTTETLASVVGFDGAGFTAGPVQTLHTAAANYELAHLPDGRCIFRQSAGTIRVLTASGYSISLGPAFSYGQNPLLISPVSNSRAAYYFDGGGAADCVLLDINGSGIISAAGPASRMFNFDHYIGGVSLPHGHALFTILSASMGNGLRQLSAVCGGGADGVKLLGTGVWPLLNIYSSFIDQLAPQWAGDSPYTVSASNYTGSYGSIMKNGVVEYGSLLEPLDHVGIALSQSGGKASVLAGAGAAEGFSGLKRGKAYSVGYNGRLCDAGSHPMRVCVGTALDETTLWFTGI